MLFKPANKVETSDITILFTNVKLEQTFLGVWFTESLPWKIYFDKLGNELSKFVGCIDRISKLLSLFLKISWHHCYVEARKEPELQNIPVRTSVFFFLISIFVCSRRYLIFLSQTKKKGWKQSGKIKQINKDRKTYILSLSLWRWYCF